GQETLQHLCRNKRTDDARCSWTSTADRDGVWKRGKQTVCVCVCVCVRERVCVYACFRILLQAPGRRAVMSILRFRQLFPWLRNTTLQCLPQTHAHTHRHTHTHTQPYTHTQTHVYSLLRPPVPLYTLPAVPRLAIWRQQAVDLQPA